jgi:hypothetical protein
LSSSSSSSEQGRGQWEDWEEALFAKGVRRHGLKFSKLIGTRDRDQVRKFARTSCGRSYMEQTTENRTQEIVADTVRSARIFMENLRDSNAEHDDNDNSASA